MTQISSGAKSPKTQSQNGSKVLFRAYKMTHFDSPFIYDGVLSVATCLGSLRKNWQVSEWIAGFSSVELKSKKGQEELIYIAKVCEQLSLQKYWQGYQERRPDKVNGGDNLYELTANGYVRIDKNGQRYQIHPNDKKDEWHRKNIKADCVLVSHEFYYFGEHNMQVLPMRSKVRVSRAGSKNYDNQVFADILKFVRANKNECERFKDENGKVGGRIIIHQGGGACGLSNVPNANKSGSCGSTKVASKASSCGSSTNATNTTKSGCGGSHTSKC